jgi:hypothetical protein
MMSHTKRFIAACLVSLSGCAPLPFALAPGAEQVRVTNVAADVADCKPVGNIQVPKDGDGFVSVRFALGQLKNQAIGLGGNAAFVTDGTQEIPKAGVAYQCPEPAPREG